LDHKATKELRPEKFYAQFKKKQKQRPKATIVAGVLLLVFMVVVLFALPEQVPWAVQKLFGAVNAILAALVGLFAFREYGRKYAWITIPLLRKKVDVGVVAAVGLFAATGAWWLSPLAPIAVNRGGPDEIARLLSEEMALAVLTMPDTTLAVIEPPLPPTRATELAAHISGDSDVYSRLIKAIAERKYIEADALSEKAADSKVDLVKLALARGQLKVFSGEYAAAIEHFEQAQAAERSATVLAQAAVAYALAGDLPKSREIASQLLNGARTGQFTDAGALGISLNLMAAISLCSGHFPEALSLAEESQLTWEAAPDSPFKAASRNNQAVVYAMLPKKYSGAATQFDGALALWRDIYGADSAHVASNQANLGVLAMAQAQFVEAESRLDKARDMAAVRVPTGSRGQFCILNALARLNTRLARFSAAATLLEAAQDCAGQSPLLEAAYLGAEGSLLAGQGKYRDASGSFSKAISECQSTVSAEHLFLADLRVRKADVTSLRGRFAEPEQDCRDVIKVVDEQLVGSHPIIARAYNTLGWDLIRADKRSAAKKQFELAQQVFEANRHEIAVSPDAAESLAGLSQTQPKREWRAGVQQLREALELDAQVFGPVLGAPADARLVNLPSTAQYLYEQAVLFERNGSGSELETAAQLFEQAMTMQEKLLPPSHPALAATYEACGRLLARMDRKQQAEEMEVKAGRARELSREFE
jgi:tetratricopeptide (TPR) repeat protein